MSRSWFGGDTTKAHFTTSYDVNRRASHAAMDACGAEFRRHGRSAKWLKLCKARDEAWNAEKAEKEARRAKVKEVGYKTPYFQFTVGDEAGKAKAKAACEAFAKDWSEKLGFELTVCEGCFL